MSTNTTAMPLNAISIGLYVTITVSSVCFIISALACLAIVTVTYLTPNLHSPTNLLVSSTCLSTLFYLTISTVNTFIFFDESISTDWSCRIQAYLYYVSLNLVIYSYIIQAISRLFWTVLYKYRYLLTMKCHLYLIIIKIIISFLLPLSSIITKDVVFRPFKMCLVAMKYRLHVFYLLVIGFMIPLLTMAVVYAIIYRHIVRATANFRRSLHGTKRDTELARNILILLSIFLFGGVPTLIYIILSNQVQSAPTALFLTAVTTPSVSVAVEKILTIILNKDIHKALKSRCMTWLPNGRTARVQPVTCTTNTNLGLLQTKTVQTSQPNETHPPNMRT